MAIVKLVDGQTISLPHEKALVMWQVLIGEIEPTNEQQAFCSKIDRIYLNRYKAPESYLNRYKTVLSAMPW